MEQKLLVRDHATMKGRVKLRAYRAGAIDEIRPMAEALMLWRRKSWKARASGAPQSVVDRIGAAADTLELKINQILESFSLGVEISNANLIMTGSLTGTDLLIQYLAGTTVYANGINYVAIGTGSTTPAAGDTQLTTEGARTAPSILNDITNNELQIQAFLPDATVPNATYTEVGCFINGTASANSGQIVNHALLGTPYAKGTGTDITIEIDLTIAT